MVAIPLGGGERFEPSLVHAFPLFGKRGWGLSVWEELSRQTEPARAKKKKAP